MALGEERFQAISQGPLFAKCHVYGTRRSLVFAKCQTEALGEADGKGWGWMPSGFAECLSSPSAWHLAKPSSPSAGVAKSQALGEAFFTKYPIFDTRRTLGHLAKPGFPVVLGEFNTRSPRVLHHCHGEAMQVQACSCVFNARSKYILQIKAVLFFSRKMLSLIS